MVGRRTIEAHPEIHAIYDQTSNLWILSPGILNMLFQPPPLIPVETGWQYSLLAFWG